MGVPAGVQAADFLVGMKNIINGTPLQATVKERQRIISLAECHQESVVEDHTVFGMYKGRDVEGGATVLFN